MTEDNKKVGKKVKIARVTADMTQVELAKRLDLDRQVLIRIENGSRPVSVPEIKKIAKVTGHDLSFFYGEAAIPGEHTTIHLSPSIRDLRDLTEEDIRLIDDLIKRLRALHLK